MLLTKGLYTACISIGDLDIEALRAKYAAAYDSDFEMPEESEDDDDEEETTEYEDSDDEAEESEGIAISSHASRLTKNWGIKL